MDRNEFMELVYETFADEPDNVLANGIIEAADAYAEHEKAQLSQEGTTSDLISRQAAIDALDFEIVHMTAYCDGKNEGNPLAQYNKGLEDGKKAIEALPSAQPEPQEGHWIDKGWNGDWAWQIDGRGNCWRVIECSECGKGVSVESNYCPHCGAHMKGAEHETD